MTSVKKIPQAMPISTTEWLNRNLEHYPITRRTLALNLGLKAHNTVSLWSHGRQNIPLKHMISMAKMFGVDPLYARNIALYEQYNDDEVWQLDERVRSIGFLTRNELDFLDILRSSGVDNPKMNDKQKEAFRRFVETLDPDLP